MPTIPHWDLSNIFPSLESKEFEATVVKVKAQLDDLEKLFAEKLSKMDTSTPVKTLAPFVGEVINRFNDLYELGGTIRAYIHSFVTTTLVTKQ